jgi:hypothetical protein
MTIFFVGFGCGAVFGVAMVLLAAVGLERDERVRRMRADD